LNATVTDILKIIFQSTLKPSRFSRLAITTCTITSLLIFSAGLQEKLIMDLMNIMNMSVSTVSGWRWFFFHAVNLHNTQSVLGIFDINLKFNWITRLSKQGPLV
jgi:hypothetical protein